MNQHRILPRESGAERKSLVIKSAVRDGLSQVLLGYLDRILQVCDGPGNPEYPLASPGRQVFSTGDVFEKISQAGWQLAPCIDATVVQLGVWYTGPLELQAARVDDALAY